MPVTLGSAQYVLEVDQRPLQRGLADAEQTAKRSAVAIGGTFAGLSESIGRSLAGVGSTISTALTRAVSGATSAASSAFAGLGRALSSSLTGAVEGAFRGLHGLVSREVGSLSRTMTSAFSGLAGGVTSALSGIPGAIKSAVSGFGAFGLAAQGVQTAFSIARGALDVFALGPQSDLEQTTAKFLAFTKDAALTQKILEELRVEAAKTPFAFGELANAAASLLPVSRRLNLDLMDLVRTAEILSVLDPAQGLEGAAFALREAAGGDFLSLVERFELDGKRLKALVEAGDSPIRAVQKLLAEMGVDAELVARQGETLAGRWSTFVDTLTNLRSIAGAPLFEALKTSLMELQTVLDQNAPVLEAFARTIAGNLRQALDGIGPRIAAFVRGFADAFSRVSRIWDDIRGLFTTGLGSAPALVNLLGQLGLDNRAIDTVRRAIARIGEVFQGLQTLAGPALRLLRQLFANVIGIAGRFITAIAPIAGWFADRIVPAVGKAIEVFRRFHEAVATALRLTEGAGLAEFVRELVNQLGILGTELFRELKAQVATIDWAAVWATMSSAASAFLTWAGGLFVNLAGELARLIGEQVAQVDWAAVWARFTAAASAFLTVAATWFTTLAGHLVTWIGDQVAKIDWKAVWLRVVDAISGMSVLFIGLVNRLAEWLGAEVAKIKWAEVWDRVTGMAAAMQKAVTAEWRKLDWGLIFGSTTEFTRSFFEWLMKALERVNWELVGRLLARHLIDALLAAAIIVGQSSRVAVGFTNAILEGIGKINWGRVALQLQAYFLNALIGAWNEAVARWIPQLRLPTINVPVVIRAITGGGEARPTAPAPTPDGPGLGPITSPGPGGVCPPGTRRVTVNGLPMCEYLVSDPRDARALGGPVERDRPYLVGERGPELFVPDQNGQILNRQQLAAQMADPTLLSRAYDGGARAGWDPSASLGVNSAAAGGSYDQRSSTVTLNVTNNVDARGVPGAGQVSELVVAQTAQAVVRLLDRTERYHGEAVDNTLGGAR